MTETLLPPQPSPPAPTRLVRPADHKLGGVCEGLGRYTGTDPLLWRVSAVMLVLFGAVGVILYGLCWILIPKEGAAPSPGERLAASLSVAWPFPLLPLAAGIALALFAVDHPKVLVPAAVLGALGWLVASRRGGVAPVAPAVLPTEPVVDWSAPSVGPAWPPPPLMADWPEPLPTWGQPLSAPLVVRRQRSRLGPVVLSGTALVCGVLLLLRVALGLEGVTAGRVLAVGLVCLGAGLVVGSVWGRARWLALFGVLLAVGLLPAQLDGGALRGGVGERTWVATGSGEHRLGIGSATLDLRSVPLAPGTRVEADLGVGQLLVLVPEGMTVAVDADVRAGEIHLPGSQTSDGTDVHRSEVIGTGSPSVTLDLSVELGSLEVRRG